MNDLGHVSTNITTGLRRFHMVVFIVVVVGALSVAVLLLNGIAAKTSGLSASPADGTTARFDQATIDRINELKTSSEPSEPLDFSKGRISPFSE